MKYLGKIQDDKDLVTKEYVFGTDTFVAKYGETTYLEMDQATVDYANAVCVIDGLIYKYTSQDPDGYFKFQATLGDSIYTYTLEDDDTWNFSSSIINDTKTSFYGTSSTAASTTAKTTSITGYSLRTGNIISIEFTNSNTANAPTLNISSTGAKAIWYKGAVTSASNKLFWLEGEIVTFIYTGTYYEAISINTLAADVDLFPVRYNSDTFQEIHDAYDKGKYIYCINGDRYFALQSITPTQAKFVCVDMASNYQIVTYTVSSSGWSVTNQYPVLSVNGYSPTNTSHGAVSVPVGYANSTNSTSKLFLVGATAQATEPSTYSNSDVYATNGVLNAKSFSVDASANIVYNSSAKSIDFTFV